MCLCAWCVNVGHDTKTFEETLSFINFINILQNQQLYAHPTTTIWEIHSRVWYYEASMMNHCTVGSLCYEVISLFTTSHMAIKFLVRTNNLCNHLFNHKYLPSRLKSYQCSKWETSQCGSFSSWIFLYLCNFISSCWVSQSHFLHEIFSNYYNSHWLLSF